jgi:hypothetical protein
MSKRDAQNPYTPTRANDPGAELIQLVIDYVRSHRSQFSSTEATNVGATVTSILNGTFKI